MMEPNWLFVTITLALSLLLWMMPTLSRSDIFFGVTVPPSFRDSPEGRHILGRYRQLMTASAVLTLLAHFNDFLSSSLPVVILALVSTLGWAWGNHMTRPHSASVSPERRATLDGARREPQISLQARIGPYLILSAATIYLYFYYDLLPDSLPVHWSGPEPDRFTPKNWLAVFRPLIMATAISLLMEFTKATLASPNFTRRLIAPLEDDRESRFFQMNLRLLLATQYLMALVFSWVAIFMRGPHAPQLMPSGWGFYGVLILALSLLPVSIYISMRYGQGGSRLPASSHSLTGAPLGDRTPDDCWKLGQFYFNPNDAAVWVEKRAGIGYTLNFARPLSWLWLFGIIAGPLILVRILR